MKFTRYHINNRSLRSFLLNNCQPIAHKQEQGHLVSVYDSVTCIEIVEKKIKQHKNDGRYNKNMPLWKNHKILLKGLK